MNTNVDPKVLRETAEQYYRSGAFYCSEALVKTLKDAFELPYSDDVVRIASGFPVGMGVGCTCGAVNAGVMVIGMIFGRNEAFGKEVARAMQVTKRLQTEFTAKRKVCCCKVLTRGLTLASPEHLEHCINITGEVTELTAKIILEELANDTNKQKEAQ